MHPSRRLLWFVVGFLVLAAVVTVVVVRRGGDDHAAAPGTTGATTPSCTTAPPLLPLLGTPGAAPRRAALAVKIENTKRGRPQAGLAEADVVFEEVVEGRLTRLLAVYQSQDPETVGPVRSARTTDLSILPELGRPLFAWSGANGTVRGLVRAADIVDVGAAAASEAYRRSPDRRSPYNLFASPEKLRAAGAAVDEPACSVVPRALFTYRAPGEALTGRGVVDASSYRVTELATAIRWDWDAGRGWVRTQDGTSHVDVRGRQVAVANVMIRSTEYRDSGQRDSVGAVVPEAVATGEGDAWLLSGGRAQPGRWRKASADGPTVYTALDGSPLRLAPGRTWVEVLPPGAGNVR